MHERLAAGDGHGAGIHRHGQNAVALGEGVGHQWSDGRDVDLQRIDAQVRLAGTFGQPDGEGFQIELLARPLQVVKLLGGEEFQRMLLVGHRAAAYRQALLGAVLRDPPLGNQLAQQVGKIERAVLGGRVQHGHGVPSTWRAKSKLAVKHPALSAAGVQLCAALCRYFPAASRP